MKRICSFVVAVAVAAVPVSAFGDGEDVKIYLDGSPLQMTDSNGKEVTPIIIDGTTYLPVRAIGKALDLEVTWDAESRSVYLSSESNEVIATDMSGFSSLSDYTSKPYELLGRSFFLNPLKELLGEDYDKLLLPLLSTCYITGTDEMITLHCSEKAVIDVYKSGRIEAAIYAPSDKFSGKNAVRYYSKQRPDSINGGGIVSFIASGIKSYGSLWGYVDFVYGADASYEQGGKYNETNGLGSFTFASRSDGRLTFSGAVDKGSGGNCTTNGNIKVESGCCLCNENGAPSILFAFSGNYLTVIGLGDVTQVLTSVYKK